MYDIVRAVGYLGKKKGNMNGRLIPLAKVMYYYYLALC